MENNMTVWGFGRNDKPLQRLLTQLPGHLTIAFLEPSDSSKLPDLAESVFHDLDIKVAAVEQRP
jgi:hypothetical protein